MERSCHSNERLSHLLPVLGRGILESQRAGLEVLALLVPPGRRLNFHP